MFKDLVVANRSYRGYDASYHFTRNDLAELVDHARLAPCSVNAQPFKYFLAWEKDTVNQIQPHTKWAGALPHLSLPREDARPTAFIVICQDLTVDSRIQAFQKDVGIVAQTLLLAAAEKGMGGCMIGSFAAKPLKETLHLGETLMPVLVIALGKPLETIVLKDMEKGERATYYRDEFDVHYVPKRKLEDILL